jgi:orotidine-5'-phosphate decarboxylase
MVLALDVGGLAEAEAMAVRLAPWFAVVKVGHELYGEAGPDAFDRMHALGFRVFCDLKLHDIPNTVERASANIARLGVAMLNVHALGGDAMMRAAVEGAQRGADEAGVEPPLVIAVTVLSSIGGDELATPASLAWEAKQAGLGGVVVSGEDVRDVRDVCGEEFCLVVPGIRPAGTNGHDQVRVLTPREAIERGADYLVVGRAITAAPDPVGAARAISRDAR